MCEAPRNVGSTQTALKFTDQEMFFTHRKYFRSPFSTACFCLTAEWGCLCVLCVPRKSQPAEHPAQHSRDLRTQIRALPYTPTQLQPQQSRRLAPTSLESRDLSTYRKVTVQMVAKVEHFGPTPACQPQKIKEVTLQVKGAQREVWLQAKCLHPHRVVLGSHPSSAVNATGHVTLPHADVSTLMRRQPARSPTIQTQRFLSFPTLFHFLPM